MLSVAPGFAADDVIIRNVDTVLEIVAITSATCARNYDEEISQRARAGLHFSQEEVAVFCVCSAKLLIREMGESDFRSFAAGAGLSQEFAPTMVKARIECAKKVQDARQGH
jgi:hypothetical protein